MTIAVDLGRKATKQTNKQKSLERANKFFYAFTSAGRRGRC